MQRGMNSSFVSASPGSTNICFVNAKKFSPIAGRYVESMGGVTVIGEHAYDGVSEWDFYNDALIHEDNSIYFFMWTPELVKAMQNEYDGSDHQEFKHRLYNVAFRPKMKYQYSSSYEKALAAIRGRRVNYPKNVDIVAL